VGLYHHHYRYTSLVRGKPNHFEEGTVTVTHNCPTPTLAASGDPESVIMQGDIKSSCGDKML
jgi:hypothetical protein